MHKNSKLYKVVTLEKLKRMIDDDPNHPIGASDDLTEKDVDMWVMMMHAQDLVEEAYQLLNRDFDKNPIQYTDLHLHKKH